ncbi:MAG: long-chain fatty acid--CoA ligase [Pseudomonadota bacterium]|nr:long-chain fatty acid--CoA ligase [Pseudomonadota bacterium]
MTDNTSGAVGPQNIGDLLAERLGASDGHAYTCWVDHQERWHEVSWHAFGQLAARYQEAFRRQGLQAGDRVAIMGPNSVDWVAFDLAAMSLGLVTVPVYHADRADSARYVLSHAGARLLLIEEAERLSGIVAEGLPEGLETVVLCSGKTDATTWVARDRWLPQDAPAFQSAALAPDDLATIVYTSGTTGRPKGVMLSHRNLLANALAAAQEVELHSDDLLVSFLPLSHMLERTCGILAPLVRGVPVAFARSVDTLLEDLQSRQPTFLVAVPRIFERVHLAVTRAMAQRPGWLRVLFNAFVEGGWSRFERRSDRGGGHPAELIYPLLRPLFARRIQRAFGGRLRAAVSGGAALPQPVARLFIGAGIEILQGYGLTEASPVVSGNRIGDNDPASVGRPLPDVEVRIADNSEILVRGPNVMLGYWRDDEATAQVLDGEGWLHSGDMGELRDGRLFITGRAKEIIVLSNGEKVSPADVEGAVITDPVIEQAMVVGEGRSFLAALVVLHPTALAGLLDELGLACGPEGALNRQEVKDRIIERMGVAMHDFPGFAKVYQVALLLEPWTVENGLLTATLKLRRNEIAARYASLIEQMYAGH